MKQTRPPLAVCPRSDDNQRAVRSRTSSTTAAWHRANSYLDMFGTHSQLEHRHDDSATDPDPDPERQPLLQTGPPLRPDTTDGSTLTQTILNTTNTLLGVGLLSLPLGFLYSGWLMGLILHTTFAVVTTYTSLLLARCMDADPSCRSYTDIASYAYGQRGKVVTMLLFSLITVTACVALVILLADAMEALIPTLTVLQWKVVAGLVLLPLHFAPFRVLSAVSVLGITVCASVVVLIVGYGLSTDQQPGSLVEAAATTLWPKDWARMPLSLGLLMSPWTAHAILPNLYSDMAQPEKFDKAMGWAFGGTWVIDMAIGACGYLMYGVETSDAIVNNVIRSTDSWALAVALTALVALMPVGKVPLMSRPLVVMTEIALKLVDEQPRDQSEASGVLHSDTSRHLARCAIRVLWVVILIGGAIVAPDFSLVMAFMGSGMCYTIAIILPLLFYLRLFGGKLSATKKVALWTLVAISSVEALIGTVCALLGNSPAFGGGGDEGDATQGRTQISNRLILS